MDYLTPKQSTETENLYRKAHGARIECERLELQAEATVKRALAICAALLASACGQIGIDAPTYEADASVIDDAGASEVTPAAAIAAATPNVPKVGDECYCCVWAPGTSYPNGDVYCMHGQVELLAGLMCHARASDAAPAWSPSSVGCTLDNPWGK